MQLLKYSTDKADSAKETQAEVTPEMKRKFVEHELKKGGNVGLTKQDRLKFMIRDYGKTILVFHVGISLVSLASFYALVSK